MAGVKSTKTLGYSLKGILNKQTMRVIEHLDDDDKVVHNLDDLLELFDGKEISFAISMKDKLENGVE